MDVTHQLVAQVGVPDGRLVRAPYTVVARCGASFLRGRSSDPMPPGFSAWASDVDCEACLAGPPGPAALGVWAP